MSRWFHFLGGLLVLLQIGNGWGSQTKILVIDYFLKSFPGEFQYCDTPRAMYARCEWELCNNTTLHGPAVALVVTQTLLEHQKDQEKFFLLDQFSMSPLKSTPAVELLKRLQDLFEQDPEFTSKEFDNFLTRGLLEKEKKFRACHQLA